MFITGGTVRSQRRPPGRGVGRSRRSEDLLPCVVIPDRRTNVARRDPWMKIVYFYLMRCDDERVRRRAPDHAAYWHALALPNFLGGPFVDRTGGLITFDATDVDEAQALVADDPFIRDRLIARSWVTEWLPDDAALGRCVGVTLEVPASGP